MGEGDLACDHRVLCAAFPGLPSGIRLHTLTHTVAGTAPDLLPFGYGLPGSLLSVGLWRLGTKPGYLTPPKDGRQEFRSTGQTISLFNLL